MLSTIVIQNKYVLLISGDMWDLGAINLTVSLYSRPYLYNSVLTVRPIRRCAADAVWRKGFRIPQWVIVPNCVATDKAVYAGWAYEHMSDNEWTRACIDIEAMLRCNVVVGLFQHAFTGMALGVWAPAAVLTGSAHPGNYCHRQWLRRAKTRRAQLLRDKNCVTNEMVCRG